VVFWIFVYGSRGGGRYSGKKERRGKKGGKREEAPSIMLLIGALGLLAVSE